MSTCGETSVEISYRLPSSKSTAWAGIEDTETSKNMSLSIKEAMSFSPITSLITESLPSEESVVPLGVFDFSLPQSSCESLLDDYIVPKVKVNASFNNTVSSQFLFQQYFAQDYLQFGNNSFQDSWPSLFVGIEGPSSVAAIHATISPPKFYKQVPTECPTLIQPGHPSGCS